jgi:hypothetical protein
MRSDIPGCEQLRYPSAPAAVHSASGWLRAAVLSPAPDRGPGEGARSAVKAVAPDAVPEVFPRAVDQNAEVVARDSQDLTVLVILLLLKSNARSYALLLGQLVEALADHVAKLCVRETCLAAGLDRYVRCTRAGSAQAHGLTPASVSGN